MPLLQKFKKDNKKSLGEKLHSKLLINLATLLKHSFSQKASNGDGKNLRGGTMGNQNMAKKHVGHGISQIKLTNYLLNNLQQFNLKPTTKLVLLYLSGCYNPKHADVFPKQKTIADRMGISERSVISAIQELHKEGLVISERKYTNRYKFTSRILNLGGSVEFFEAEEVADEKSKTCSNESENFAPACNRTTIEQEKNNSDDSFNDIEEFKILKNYAEQKGAKNVTAYIKALKANGSADRIIKQAKEKAAADRYHAKQIEETKKLIERNSALTGVDPKECERLQEVLRRIRQ